MFNHLTKEDHQHIINKFYVAGYITFSEKQKLLRYLNEATLSIHSPLSITVRSETRTLCYRYIYSIFAIYVVINVEDDFEITYNVEKDSFTANEY